MANFYLLFDSLDMVAGKGGRDTVSPSPACPCAYTLCFIAFRYSDIFHVSFSALALLPPEQSHCGWPTVDSGSEFFVFNPIFFGASLFTAVWYLYWSKVALSSDDEPSILIQGLYGIEINLDMFGNDN